MDLIFTDENRVDLGVIPAYAFDLSYGATENDFASTIYGFYGVFHYGKFFFKRHRSRFACCAEEYDGVRAAFNLEFNQFPEYVIIYARFRERGDERSRASVEKSFHNIYYMLLIILPVLI